ncbi:aconitase family protein, partial [bacterium]|nr:aconitase family protein [bacterium]
DLQSELEQLRADTGAYYAKELLLDLSSIQPHVSGPNTVKDMTPVSVIREKKVQIDKAYLVSCVNSRTEDLAEAAASVRGEKIADHVEFYIAAASSEVEEKSKERGDWQTLLDSGAIPLPPGCGPCIGLGVGTLEDGEVGISATNRNFKGRMGSRSAEAYLASPAVVAASALSGYIDYPGDWRSETAQGQIRVHDKPMKSTGSVEILEGFPRILEGELIFCYQDNLNTDGIYPGKYTYIDDFSLPQQAEVVMENYDPEFAKLVQEGDILVGGFNFGTGSSREQAATALKARGLTLVIAGSFSETYKRNALNNGFLTLEAPSLIENLKARFGTKRLTIRTGVLARIDFENVFLMCDGERYAFDPVGTAAQELIITGGLESWVKKELNG